MSDLYWIAIYLRLSKEDEEIADESNSIINQRSLLKEYVKKHFEHYKLKEFVDDGFSGTNFLRPGITDMMNQIRDGKINCVIVKDFSRFSRDYIELGSCLDQIFPFLGVRFISLNDNYDSAEHLGNTTDLDTSFKGLMYDLYSKDLSVKVKSSLRARKGQGQYISCYAPFGYTKDRGDRHKLIIAEDEAKIVRRIFALTLEGKTSIEIAKLFNREKVPTPIAFKIRKKKTSRKPLGDSFKWDNTVICAILKNRVYAGDMVYDKFYKDEVGGKNHLKPRSEWKIYKDHHAAIISRDIFDKIQENRKQTRSTNPKSEETKHPLQGKVVCGGCGRSMSLRKSLNPYFSCKMRYEYADAEKCVGYVNLMFLEQIVLYRIGEELSRQEKLEQMKLNRALEISERMKTLTKDKELLLMRKALLQRKRMEDYEKSVFDKEYKFQIENVVIEQVETRIGEVECEISRLKEELPKKREQFTEGWGEGLTSEVIGKLIEKIVVYDEQHIEIEWKFDKF